MNAKHASTCCCRQCLQKRGVDETANRIGRFWERAPEELPHADWSYARRLEADLKLSEARLAEAQREVAAWKREFGLSELEHGNKRRELEGMLAASNAMLKDQRRKEQAIVWLVAAVVVLCVWCAALAWRVFA